MTADIVSQHGMLYISRSLLKILSRHFKVTAIKAQNTQMTVQSKLQCPPYAYAVTTV